MLNIILKTHLILTNDIAILLGVITAIIACIGAVIQLINSRTDAHRAYLHPSEIWFYKNKWIRFYEGIDIPKHIPHVAYSNLTTEQKKYFNNCKNAKNLGKVYFDSIGGEPILVLNMGTRMPNKLIEHNCNVITFDNRGDYDITKFTINYIKINTLNGGKYYLYGGDNKCYTNIIYKGEKIHIGIDEVIDELSFSSCKISKERYDELVDIDVLKKDSKAEPLFCFAIVKANITLENAYGKKFNYELIIEMKDDHLNLKIKHKKFLKQFF